MPLDYSLEALQNRLESHAQTFDTLLKLIPAKYYITDHTDDDKPSKFMKNKRKQAPKQAVKEASKKAKKAKLDPESHKSVAELQREAAERKEAEKKLQDDDEIDDENESSDEIDDDEMVEANFAGLGNGIASDDEEEEDDEDDEIEDAEEKMDVETSTTDSANITPMVKTDISELKERLHKRIADLRKNRNAPNSDPSNAKSRDSILQSRMKRKQDRKKNLQAQKEKRSKGSVNEEIIKESTVGKSGKDEKFSTSSIKEDSDLFFGRIETGAEHKKKKGPSDAKTQLKAVEAKQQKLERLRKEDKERASQLEEKETWKKALSLASGEKVKDDVKLLKKTIKREEHVKLKSAKAWNERKEKVKKDEADKVKKRTANIQKKIDAKKDKRMGKKPKARPGFEGKGKKPMHKKGSKGNMNKKK
ncbi:surfeit locus protein 6-domain-containing protein [Umbelopsis sp. PMI_123]|nr:surfeit locus protein 6-domain-containing protein [Umbelopsis sp. PMI_123]